MSERIAKLRIELQELEPKIWRRIDMPLSTTLEALHDAIQMTMGWTFSHIDPIGLDEERARFGMENMARRRRGPLASHRTGSRRPKR